MCLTCGCGMPDHDHDHEHDHEHSHEHGHDHAHETGAGSRLVTIEQDILAHNNRLASGVRAHLAEKGVLALNLMSSPGSGKTTLLCKTVEALKGHAPLAVIEGDQQTSFDAERIRAAGVPAHQVNTGKGCHLDAHMIAHALEHLDLSEDGILFIENVGNLVCPAGFDLGEAAKVVILSVTEGEDKPLKYPDMFAACDLMLINKVDLLPYLSFDVARCIEGARRVNPGVEAIEVSATTGVGMEAWLDWIEGRSQALLAARAAELEAMLASVRAKMKG